MTTTTAAPPTPNTPLGLARSLLTGGVIGGSLAAFAVGCVLEDVPLIVTSLAVPTGYGLLTLLAGAPRRAREAAVVPRTALALIEDVTAVRGEDSDVPVRFDLTVAPDEGPAFRVRITQDVNLVDLPDYRRGGVLVVEYPPDRPWRVRIVKRPTPAWEERAAGARIDSVPRPAPAGDRVDGSAGGFVALLGILLGAALVVALFRAELFDADPAAQPSAVSTTSTTSTTFSSTTTTVVTSASGTVALGEGRSLLDEGELRRAVDSLTGGEESRQALTVVVQDRLLSVVFPPGGAGAARFDPRSLPYDRVPALVEEARRSLGTGSPQSWQLTVDRLGGSLTIRVTVTGSGGTASLEADGRGEVVRRSPVR
ncbi:hypothetical protein ACFQ6N_06755 [Kitasatospora sp. NPDC056446]|uniref:hypothetical protein n=1 Tax=Kitasatospora sp. NPDC056446 TaxID=3345819 RepID=UPI00368E46AB